MSDDISTLRRILRDCRTVAIVGLSADWHRPSNFVGKYLQQHGYRIVPVNPRYDSILGERSYASLEDIPFKVDMVDVFRRTDDVLPFAQAAIAIGAKCLWQQIGVKNLRGRRAGARRGAGFGDGPLRQDRTRAAVRRAALGGRQHPRHLRQDGPSDMADRQFKPETLAIHAGQIPDAATGARALPIYQTTSFVFDSADHAASLFNLQTFGNVYSRLSNPTVAALEERVAALEGGRAAVASASGMAAEAMALMTILQQGDHVVAAGALYGGSVSMLSVNLAKFGIETSFVDATQPEAFAAAIRPNTRALFAESLGNPSMLLLDIAAVADVAHAHGAAAGDRQHRAVAVPVQPDRLRRRHRGALGHQVPGRPRHHAGRRDGGERQVPLGQRQVPGHDRAVARLPRREVLRDLRRLRLLHARAHGDAARLRRGAVADERLADPAGRGDAAAAHGAAQPQRAGGGALPAAAPAA